MREGRRQRRKEVGAYKESRAEAQILCSHSFNMLCDYEYEYDYDSEDEEHIIIIIIIIRVHCAWLRVCVDALVSLAVAGMGKKGKFKNLKDLYHTTQLPTQPFKFEMEETSIACSLCATRCSSCMHGDRVAAIAGVGTGDLTDNNSKEKRASRCSSNDAILFSPLLSSACEYWQHSSSEASNIFSSSSCHDLFSGNAESQVTFRDSASCKEIELLLNIRKAQPARESGDTPKGLANFDNQRFSNQLEKHKELEILVDNISCVKRSDSAYLAIGNHNGDPDRKSVSCSLASDDSSPVDEMVVNERLGYPFVAGTHFDKASGNHNDVQNFTEKHPLAEVVLSNRSDQSDISSLKDFYDCAISEKGSSERVESSLAKASISRLGSQIDGIYGQATFGGADAHLNCFEIENYSYHKNHLQESVAVIKNTAMQESRQSQPGDPRDVSDLMDDEDRSSGRMIGAGCESHGLYQLSATSRVCSVIDSPLTIHAQLGHPSLAKLQHMVRVCDTCGDVGFEASLAICNKCTDGAEHIYCMRVKLAKVPEGDWTCAECMPRAGTDKLVQDKFEEAARKSKGRLTESSKSSKLKFRSSCARKSGTNGVSITSHISAKRHGVPLEYRSMKKARAIGPSAVPPRSSEPCNDYLLRKDFSCEKFKKVKMKSVNDIIYSGLQSSCNSQETAEVPQACADKSHVGTLEGELDKKEKALETRVISPKASNPSKPPSKKLGKAKLEAAGSVTSLEQSSYDTEEKAKLPYCLGDESPKLGSQTEIARDKCSLLKSRSSRAANFKSKEQLAKGGCLQKQKVERNPAFHDDKKGKDPRTVSKSNSVISGKSNAPSSEVLLANAYELHNPATCLLVSDSGITAEKNEKETISSGETLFSGSSCCNLDAVESSEQLDHRLQPSNYNTHTDPNCPNEKKKNESCQAEHPTKAATDMSIYKLCAGLVSDERSHSRDLAQVEAAILSQGLVTPKPHYTWIGKFQIHNSEGIASTCDGIQAHLSTCASLKVLEVVDRLPEIIILEELPRLRTWPSQFMGSQASEENIALYFFAKDLDSYRIYYRELMDYMTKNDLALKGNLDEFELIIFPSNILPEKSQRWNDMLFLWGVFRGRKVNNSANTPVSNSLELENRYTMKAFDLNTNPQDGNGDDMARVDEIPESDSIGTRPSGDRNLLVGESSDVKGGEKPEGAVIDLNLSLWSQSATPEDGSELAVRDNVEKPSTSLSLAPPAPSIHEENLDSLEVQMANTLILLKGGRF